jgi:hypothetical protein
MKKLKSNSKHSEKKLIYLRETPFLNLFWEKISVLDNDGIKIIRDRKENSFDKSIFPFYFEKNQNLLKNNVSKN